MGGGGREGGGQKGSPLKNLFHHDETSDINISSLEISYFSYVKKYG